MKCITMQCNVHIAECKEEEKDMIVNDRIAAYYEYIRTLRRDDDDNGGPGRPQTLAEYNADLEEGIAAVERGEYLTVEELMEVVKTW